MKQSKSSEAKGIEKETRRDSDAWEKVKTRNCDDQYPNEIKDCESRRSRRGRRRRRVAVIINRTQ